MNILNDIINNKKILKEIIENEGDVRNMNNVKNSMFVGTIILA